MSNPFSRVFSRLTAHVCSNCEGGSGAFYNAETGELSRCAVCSGSGLESSAGTALIVELSLARTARAKEQRPAA